MPSRIARQALSFCHPLRAASCVGPCGVRPDRQRRHAADRGRQRRHPRDLPAAHPSRRRRSPSRSSATGATTKTALKKLNYFLRDWRNDDQTRMDPQLFDILWEVTREVDTKEPIRIVSSYRSPATNAMLRRRSRGVAQFSQHMLGKAIDFNIPGVSVEQLRAARPAAAARRRRLLSGLVRARRRRLGAPLAAHDARPACARVPERPHGACPVRRPAAFRLCARARRHREARRLEPVRHVARGGAQRRRDRRRRTSASLRRRNRRRAMCWREAVRLLDRRGRGRGQQSRRRRAAETRVAAAAKPVPEARVPLPQARPHDQSRKPARRFRARLRDLHAVHPARAHRAAPAAPRSPSRPRSAPRAARRRRASRPGSMTPSSPAPTACRPTWRSPMRPRRPLRTASARPRSRRRWARDARRAGRDHAGRAHPAEGRAALQRSLAARHHARDQRALRDEHHGLRQARRAPGAHDDDQAGRRACR